MTEGKTTPWAGAGQRLCKVPHIINVYKHIPGVAAAFTYHIWCESNTAWLTWPEMTWRLLDKQGAFGTPLKVIWRAWRSQYSQTSSPCTPTSLLCSSKLNCNFSLVCKVILEHALKPKCTPHLALMKLHASETRMVRENCLEPKCTLWGECLACEANTASSLLLPKKWSWEATQFPAAFQTGSLAW